MIRDNQGYWAVSSVMDLATIRLTDLILGHGQEDLEQMLKEIAGEIGVGHIAYLRLSEEKSSEANLLTGVSTYPFAWQARYFLKQYFLIDPVIAHGREAVVPFDWDEVPKEEAAVRAFFDDAEDHDLGSNGVSIPIRRRGHAYALTSFTSNHSKAGWAAYKARSRSRLELMAILIDSAASVNFKLKAEPVELSGRERQCLMLAARGKTYQDIAGILGLSFGTVKNYLDTARGKLNCSNLPHAVGVATATGIIAPVATMEAAASVD